MTAPAIFSLGIAVVSAAISTFVGVLGLRLHRRQRAPGALPFAVYALSAASWTIGFIFELLADTLAGKVFWDDFQFIGFMVMPVAGLIFALEFTSHGVERGLRTWLVLLLVPIASLLYVATDRWHHQLRPDVAIVPSDPFDTLSYPFAPPFVLMTAFAYGTMFAATGLLLGDVARRRGPHDFHRALVAAGFTIATLSIVLLLAGRTFAGQRDVTPVTFGIGNSVLAWGLLRQRLLDVRPAARDAVVEAMDDAVIALDLKGRIMDFNRSAAAHVLGAGSPRGLDVSGRELAALCPELASACPPLAALRPGQRLARNGASTGSHAALVGTGETQAFAFQRARPGECDARHYDVQPSRLDDASGRPFGMLLVLRDVTALKKAQDALEATNRQLETFSYSVSHDLRAPLRTVRAFAKILDEDHGAALSADARTHVKHIIAGATEMGQLIDDLLRFARLGRQAITPMDCDLVEIVNEVVAGHAEAARAAGRKVEVRVAERMPCVGDPSLLRVVFENLISNAFKYTRRREVGTIEIGVKPGAAGAAPVYFVRDNGTGFDMKQADGLFSVFQRLHSQEEFEGTGVGLALAHSIVVRHGGRIWAESVVGEGATFFLTLAAG